MNQLVTYDYTVLVVEDELPLQSAIRTKLENNGLNVVTARTIKQARDYLRELPKVDLIWLDHYLLGEGSGLIFVAELKDPQSDFKHIPIFVVSNSADQQKVESYLHLGVSKYFTKTECTLSEIIADVKAYLEKQGRE